MILSEKLSCTTLKMDLPVGDGMNIIKSLVAGASGGKAAHACWHVSWEAASISLQYLPV